MATISKYTTAGGETLYRVRYRTTGQSFDSGSAASPTKRDAEQFAATVEVANMRGGMFVGGAEHGG